MGLEIHEGAGLQACVHSLVKTVEKIPWNFFFFFWGQKKKSEGLMDPAQPSFPETAFSDTEAVVFYYYCYFFYHNIHFLVVFLNQFRFFRAWRLRMDTACRHCTQNVVAATKCPFLTFQSQSESQFFEASLISSGNSWTYSSAV